MIPIIVPPIPVNLIRENMNDLASLLTSGIHVSEHMSDSEAERLCREQKAETDRYCREMNGDYKRRIIDSEDSEVEHIIRDFHNLERPSEEKIAQLQKEYLRLITKIEVQSALNPDEYMVLRTGFGMLKRIMKETGIKPLQKIVDEGCTANLQRDLMGVEITAHLEKAYKKVSRLEDLENALFELKNIRMGPSEETVQKWYGIIIGLSPDQSYESVVCDRPLEFSPIFKLNCLMKLEEMTGIKPKEEYKPQLDEFKKEYLQYLSSRTPESLSLGEIIFGYSRLQKKVESFGEEKK